MSFLYGSLPLPQERARPEPASTVSSPGPTTPGSSGPDLSQGYTLLVSEHPEFVDLGAVRIIVRNSLEASFLDGESLYLDHGTIPGRLNTTCSRDLPEAAVVSRVSSVPSKAGIVARRRTVHAPAPSDPLAAIAALLTASFR